VGEAQSCYSLTLYGIQSEKRATAGKRRKPEKASKGKSADSFLFKVFFVGEKMFIFFFQLKKSIESQLKRKKFLYLWRVYETEKYISRYRL